MPRNPYSTPAVRVPQGSDFSRDEAASRARLAGAEEKHRLRVIAERSSYEGDESFKLVWDELQFGVRRV